MTSAAQLSFPFDLTPCGVIANEIERRRILAGIVDKVEADDDMGLLGGDDGEDFGDGEDAGDDYEEEDYADAAE